MTASVCPHGLPLYRDCEACRPNLCGDDWAERFGAALENIAKLEAALLVARDAIDKDRSGLATAIDSALKHVESRRGAQCSIVEEKKAWKFEHGSIVVTEDGETLFAGDFPKNATAEQIAAKINEQAGRVICHVQTKEEAERAAHERAHALEREKKAEEIRIHALDNLLGKLRRMRDFHDDLKLGVAFSFPILLPHEVETLITLVSNEKEEIT